MAKITSEQIVEVFVWRLVHRTVNIHIPLTLLSIYPYLDGEVCHHTSSLRFTDTAFLHCDRCRVPSDI